VHVELVRVALDGSTAVLAALDSALYPIEFSPDGAWLYYASVSAAGSDLWRAAAAGGSTEQVAHLSDGISRDWDLSPDGARLAYLAQTEDNDTLFSAQVLDLAAGEAQALPKAAGDSQFAPVWESSGTLTTGRLGETGGVPVRSSVDGGTIVASGAALPGAAGGGGFDVPISWSPDGARLAARHFAGTSTADPGPSRVELLGTDGARRAVSPNSDVTIAGWLEGP
jgi:TolB protein